MTAERWQVPLADVAVDDELIEAVFEAVRSGWWSRSIWLDISILVKTIPAVLSGRGAY